MSYDAEHRGGRYKLLARRYVRPGVNQMPGDIVDLTHDEAVLALAQKTAVHVENDMEALERATAPSAPAAAAPAPTPPAPKTKP